MIGFGQNIVETNITGNNRINVQIIKASPDSFPVISVYFQAEKDNMPIFGLLNNEILVRENNVECDIIDLQQKSKNSSINIVLVVDHSPSISPSFSAVQEAGIDFAMNFGEVEDSLLIVGFNENVDTTQKFINAGSDFSSIFTIFHNLQPTGTGTAFYDAINYSINKLKAKEGLNIIVALTDGVDNSSSSSMYKIINTAKEFNIPIYTIGFLGNNTSRRNRNYSICKTCLDSISSESKGKSWYTSESSDLIDIYNEINLKISALYKLTYLSKNLSKNDTSRIVRLKFQIEKELLDFEFPFNVPKDTIVEIQQDQKLEWQTENYIFLTVISIGIILFVIRKMKPKVK